jgi:hypothetical protein
VLIVVGFRLPIRCFQPAEQRQGDSVAGALRGPTEVALVSPGRQAVSSGFVIRRVGARTGAASTSSAL